MHSDSKKQSDEGAALFAAGDLRRYAASISVASFDCESWI
jgi:hypothetical protein